MKKSLLPLMVAASMPMVAAASDVQVYGYAHLALELLDDGDNYSEMNLASRASNLGIRGTRELHGITLTAQFEQQFDYDTGAAFTARRNTFVGASGDFGAVRVGYFDTPYKMAFGPANLFPDQIGDIRNITRLMGDATANARLDERTSNTLMYQTPRFGDLSFDIAYSLNEGSTAQDGLDTSVISLGANYVTDMLRVALAYEAWGEDASGGERDGLRLSASYQLNADWRVVGFFQTVTNEVSDVYTSDTVGAGFAYRLTEQTDLRASYFYRAGELSDSDSGMLVVGVNHSLAQGLYAYANLAITDNDDNVALTPWGQPSSVNPDGSMGDAATGLAGGLVYRF